MDIKDRRFKNPEVEYLHYEQDGKVLACCYDPDIKEYKVEMGVEIIGSYSFSDCKNLETVYIPYSVQFIDSCAFRNCRKLKRVIINWWYCGVESIDACAFSGCTNLESIELPESLTEIGDFAFADCTNLKNITLPSSLKTIGINPFAGCNINIKSKAKDYKVYRNLLIKQSYLMVISSLKDTSIVIVPDAVQYIGPNAFVWREKLEMVLLPLITREIDYRAFYHCSNLRHIYTQGDIYKIENEAFRYCGLTTFTCNFDYTKINANAFSDCEHLRKFTYSKSCDISPSAFEGSKNVRFMRRAQLKVK